MELTPEGATFFEQAMQGHGGSRLESCTTCGSGAKLPPVKIDAYFHASKFYSFYQTIDTDWNFWAEDSYRETIREQMIQSESMFIEAELGRHDRREDARSRSATGRRVRSKMPSSAT